jgi:hypothetical protein
MNERLAWSNRRLIKNLLLGVFVAALVVRAWVTVVAWLESGGGGASSAQSVDDVDRVRRVLIISVDGLRPDLLLRARTPHIRSLMARGSFTMWARTTEASITLPSHTSMLTGVRPEFHRIFWNTYIENVYPEVPTIFELAHKVKENDKRLTTALVAGKTKFHELAKPGSVDYQDIYQDGEGSNVAVGHSAADIIVRHAPRVMFVHLPDVDARGHARGWGSPEQMEAIERADDAVGMILDALASKGMAHSTLIILSADHGGQGWTHGPNDPRSRHIPWIVAGPGVRRNYDLAHVGTLIVNTEDTFATACTMMNIPMPQYRDGKFIKEILESNDDLLQVSNTTADKKGPEPIDRWWEPPPYHWERATIPPHHN